MPKTPKRAGRAPQAGSHFLSEIVARNVRSYRALTPGRLTQDDLAELMNQLGHGWVRATVSEVERNGRTVTVDELAGLAAVLHASVAQLLDPAGPQRSIDTTIDLGGRQPIPGRLGQEFISDLTPDPERARLIAMFAGLGSEPVIDQEE